MERKDTESRKVVIVQIDDLLTFRQFSKKSADDSIDVCDTIAPRRFQSIKVMIKVLSFPDHFSHTLISPFA